MGRLNGRCTENSGGETGAGGRYGHDHPSTHQILEGYPGAEVHLVTSPDGRQVLKGFHQDWPGFSLFKTDSKTWWIGPRLVKELKAENYERIFLFETNPHYTDLLNGVCSNLHRITNLEPDVHYCVRCIEVVESNMDNAPKRSWLTLPVTENGQTKAEDLLGRHGVTESTFLVGMHPTYSGMTLPFYRQWGGRKNTVPGRKRILPDLQICLTNTERKRGRPKSPG